MSLTCTGALLPGTLPLLLQSGAAVAVGGVEEQGEGNRVGKGRGRLLGEGWYPEIRTESDAHCASTSAPALLLIYLSFNAFCFVLVLFSNLF